MFERFHSGRCGLDGNNAIEACSEFACKEAHAGKKVPGKPSLLICGDGFDQVVDKPAIHLEKGAVIYAEVEISRAIGEGVGAPAGKCAGRVAGTAPGGELRALEGGDAFVERLGQAVEVDFGVVCGEKRREERGLVPIAEELEFMWAQICGDALKEICGGFGSGEQQRCGNGTLPNCDDGVGFAAAIAEASFYIEGEADAIAVGPWICREDCDVVRRANAGALQRFAQDGIFEGQLVRVTRVLVVAASAWTEVWTTRRDTLRRRCDYLREFGGGVAGLALRDADVDLLTG